MLLIILNHLISLEYGFKKDDRNTTCNPREVKEFTGLDDAKKQCKNTRNCKGVLQPDREDRTKYYLCNDAAKLIANTLEPSCFYERYDVENIGSSIFSNTLFQSFRFYTLISIFHYFLNFTVDNPTNCEWNEWESTPCSQTCGGGSRTKTRTKNVEEAFGGTCEGEKSVTEDCNTEGCPSKILVFLS